MEIGREKKCEVGADHKDIAMGEIDKPKHAVNQRVAQRDKSVDAS